MKKLLILISAVLLLSMSLNIYFLWVRRDNSVAISENSERFAVDNSGFHGGQRDLTEAALREWRKADDTLNGFYDKILKEYAKNQVFLSKFIEAEKAWIKFRDAYLDSLYPEEDKQLHYGSVFPMAYLLEKANLTWERVKQLNGWLELAEGDVGSGSRRAISSYKGE